jgi:lipase chaperone LimK
VRRAPATAWLAAAGALVALAIAFGLHARSERLPAEAVAARPPLRAPKLPAAGADAPVAAGLPPLPASLRGSEVGGALRADAQGRFVPDPEALALFDHFLSAAGEEPDAVIRARILAEIARRLAPGAAREAEALLDLYLAYRNQAAELYASDLAAADPEQRFRRVHELREEVFGRALAEALYGEEERIVANDLERHRLLAQSELDPTERERRLAALDAELPAAEREARALTRAVIDLRDAESALRAAGASEGEIRAERERRFGPEAAERLAALDERRAAWQRRVSDYRAEREELAERGLPADEFESELARLRAERFQGPELARILALDGVAAEPAPDAR